MTILDGKDSKKLIIDLLDQCKNFSIAVAWITDEKDVFPKVQECISKAKAIIVGIDYYHTSPDSLEWLQKNAKGKAFVGNSKRGVFHPKAYIFYMKNKTIRVVIGSANLTKAAFTENDEMCIYVELMKGSIQTLESSIDKWKKAAKKIVDFDIDQYRLKYYIQGRQIRSIAKSNSSSNFTIHPDLKKYDFDLFYQLCATDPYHSINDRLRLLESSGTYSLNHDDFICMAGIMNANSESEYGDYYGFFGGISQDKAYMGCVRDASYHARFVELLNTVPASPNTVTRNFYVEFVKNLNSLINNSDYHIKNVDFHFSAATRLLSFVRPDFFFCLNGGNADYIADDLTQISGNKYPKNFGGSDHERKINLYWDAIALLHDSLWYQSKLDPKWDDLKKKCWHARTAMIDSLYYKNQNSQIDV